MDKKKLLILFGGKAPDTKITATTTGAATLTLAGMTVAAGRTVTVDWGDASTTTYTAGAGARTHAYAGAGVFTVKFSNPDAITALTLSDNKITLNSRDIKRMVNMLTFQGTTFKAGTFNSSDISAWRPTSFRFDTMPAGYAGTFNSSDVSAWRPTSFSLYTMPSGYAGTFNSSDVSAWRPTTILIAEMPAGYAGTFNSSDVSAWRPTSFSFHTMPTATFTLSFPDGGYDGWVSTTSFRMSANALTQVKVDQILSDMWTAFATRTGAAGTINLGGTNQAPSGTLQAANPPTTGKEFAYELVNDSQNINPTKKWTTVTITA